MKYVVWGTRGPRSFTDTETGTPLSPLPGFYHGDAPRDRIHQTEKPLAIMRQLVRIAPKGGLVLDPFTGSGTTGVAALIEGRRFYGAELTDHYAGVTAERLAIAERGYRDDGAQLTLDDALTTAADAAP